MEMGKGINEALSVFGVWFGEIFEAIYATVLLPFYFIQALFV